MPHPHSTALSSKAMREAKKRYGHFITFIVHDDALYREIAYVLTTGQVTASPYAGRMTFIDLFEAELSRIADYAIGQHDSQERSAKALLANAFTLIDGDSTTNAEVLQGLQHQANTLL